MNQELSTIADNPAQPAAAYLATQRNKATTNSELNKIARLMGAEHWQAVNWGTLNAANVAAIFARVEGAPATRNKTLSALKGVARSAWRLGLITSEDLARIRDIGGDKGSRVPSGRNVESWEIAAMMRKCAEERADPQKAPAAIRDAAVIALAVKTGARRDELANVRRADMTETADGVEIKTIGKGNKQRVLYVDNGALKALHAWLAIAGADEYLFRPIDQNGTISTGRMSNVAMHNLLIKRAIQAGLCTDRRDAAGNYITDRKGNRVKDATVNWHDFRRTFAGALLDAGEDISTVSKLMGHASTNTTARYDRRGDETRRRAAKKISVPYF